MTAVVAGDWAGGGAPFRDAGEAPGPGPGPGGGESAVLGFRVAGVKGARGAHGGRGRGAARFPLGIALGGLWKSRAGLTWWVDSHAYDLREAVLTHSIMAKKCCFKNDVGRAASVLASPAAEGPRWGLTDKNAWRSPYARGHLGCGH